MKLKTRIISLLLAVAIFACLIPQADTEAHAAVSAYQIVSYARQYIGYPYVRGTAGPKSFDCSGFVHYVFAHFGIDLPKGAANYYNNPTKYGKLIDKGSIEKAQMGDIIAWSGHVAIYTEDGYCVEALGTKYGVIERVKVNRHTNGMNYKVIRINGVVAEGTPLISSLNAGNSGVEIKWGKVANAQKYRVYRKGSDGKWSALGNTTSTSFVDTTAVSGKTYTYTVRCISSDGKNFTSDYDDNGKSIKFLGTPKLSSATDTSSGIQIKWNKVSGAAKYRVFYKAGSGSWTKIADTTSTSYTWTGAKSGTSYKFTVRCVSSDGKTHVSGYAPTGLSLKFITAPKLTSVYAENGGTLIKWNKVNGAEKYRVYYKNASGGWTKIGDTTENSYTWAKAEYGKTYTFTVRCVSKDGSTHTSLYDTKGKSFKSFAAPKLLSATITSNGIKIDWGKVTGAEKYRVYYKTASTNWTKAADTTGTSYTWTGAKTGTNYTFTVRCITGDEKFFTSGFDSKGLSVTYLSTPKLSSVANGENGVQIAWGAVSGAQKYRVFYKNSDGSWTKIADTTSTSYTWTGAKSNTKYSFTVRCVSSDGKTHTSGYDSTGKSVKYIAAPKLSSVEANNSGVKITWGKVTGAEKYRVYYKTATGWTKIADTTSTSYTWTGAKNGTKYTYTVRCISGDGKTFTSGFDSKGLSLTAVATPKLSSVENTATGVKITWSKVSGAAKYRIYYKTGSGNWTKITDTTSTSYTWTGAKSNTKYSFTVRCVTSDGKTHTGGYDETGKSIKYIAAPTLSSVTNVETGVQIKWGKVTGAEKYRVYYKTATTDWKKLADTASTSYTWTGAKSGTKYTFTVCCINSAGTACTGAYDPNGLSITYLEAPKISSLSADSSGIQISWGEVPGAERYGVLCKTEEGSWIKIADTADTSYTWTECEGGTTYTFTVCCLSSDGKNYTSAFDSIGKSITYE